MAPAFHFKGAPRCCARFTGKNFHHELFFGFYDRQLAVSLAGVYIKTAADAERLAVESETELCWNFKIMLENCTFSTYASHFRKQLKLAQVERFIRYNVYNKSITTISWSTK